MKRVTVTYHDGDEDVYKCRAASYGDRSRNLILYGVIDPVTDRPLVDTVLLTLATVVSLEEAEW